MAHRCNLGREAGYRIERLGQAGGERLALRGQLEAVRAAPEQRDTQAVLKQAHHAAHGRLGDMELTRGRGEAAVPTSRLECAQAVQGMQSSHAPTPTLGWAETDLIDFAWQRLARPEDERIEQGELKTIQLGLLHVPQAFLQGLIQTYARR